MTIAKKKNHLWIWFFLFLFVASVSVATFMIVFNLSLQLTPEQLETARLRWKEQGPNDYLLSYTKRIGAGVDVFKVTVRKGKVEDVVMNDGIRLEPEQRAYHSMERVFRDIERFMELDAQNKKRNYVTAIFDERTGAVRKYVRRVMGTSERLELELKVEALP